MSHSFVNDGYERACRGLEQARQTIVVTVRHEYAERLSKAGSAERAELELEIRREIEARLRPPLPSPLY
jgi:hypothetical protein